MMRPSIILASIVSASALALAQAPSKNDAPKPRVTVDTGSLQGLLYGNDVEMFLGIPYAAAPIGDLRWKPPAPAASWHGLRDASEFGPVCPQSEAAARGVNEQAQEDSQIYLMEGYIALNRLDEAKAVYQRSLDKKLEYQFLHDDRYEVAFLENDPNEMDRQLATVAAKPGLEDILFAAESDTHAYHGRLDKARQLTARAVKSSLDNGEKETAALYLMSSALREAEFGNVARARDEVKRALATASTRDVQTLAAITLARCGDAARARAITDDLQKQHPVNTILNHYWLPVVRGYIELQGSYPDAAIKILEETSPFDLAFPNPQYSEGGTLYPVYVRGQAYLALRQGKEAAVEFQKFIDHRTIVANYPLASLARLGLARAYTLQGDTAKARTAYQDFFALLKDADPDIPILKQAKAEYAKLQ